MQKIPEILLGALLALACFAIGAATHLIPVEVTHDFSWAAWIVRDASGFFTALMFVVGIAQLWLFYRQLTMIREGMDDTRRAARAAESAALATTDSVTLARDNAVRQLRAYVMVDAGVIKHLEVGKKPRAELTLKNSGVTPAHDMTHWCAMGFAPFPFEGEVPGSEEDDNPLPPKPIGAGGEFHIWTQKEHELDDATLIALRAGTHALYVIGEVLYRDAFDVLRKTEFLLFVGGPVEIDGRLSAYVTGNRIE